MSGLVVINKLATNATEAANQMQLRWLFKHQHRCCRGVVDARGVVGEVRSDGVVFLCYANTSHQHC